jgi:hypothetical protein
MTNNNYIRHFSVLGKLAKLYDLAIDGGGDFEDLLAAFVDQYADGTVLTLPAVKLFPTYQAQIVGAIANGTDALESIAKSAAMAYLIDPTFTGGLTTTPAAATASAVLAALQTEMGAGVDNKTLTTKASTGLVNFFDAILGSPGTWNTEADETADYKDSVYCVIPVV